MVIMKEFNNLNNNRCRYVDFPLLLDFQANHEVKNKVDKPLKRYG